jgi:hypothetical protein
LTEYCSSTYRTAAARYFCCVFFLSLTIGAFGNPPGGVGVEMMFGFEPDAARGKILGAVLFGAGNSLFKGAAGFGFEVGDPFLDHADTGVNVVERGGFRGGVGHGASG